MWNVNKYEKELDNIKRYNFHSVAAILLFITKHTRDNIEPTVAYLCTSVTKSEKDGWRKLRRLMN